MYKKLLASHSKSTFINVTLILLSAIPVLAGIIRLVGLEQGQTVSIENARFFYSPLPIYLHIFCASFFCVLGVFQFDSEFRRRHLTWHRISGRFLMVCGLFSALTGIWMTLNYPIPLSLQGDLLYGARLLSGGFMVVCLGRSLISILNSNVAVHRAWMMRAYAIGQGAGTQVLILGSWMVIAGETSGLTRDILMTLAWCINLAFVEWVIRSKKTDVQH